MFTSKTEILSIDKDWEEGDVPVQQGPEVVISEGVVEEVSQFQYLGSVLVTDGRLDVELRIRKGEAVGRFKQFEKMWGTKHLSLATKVKCYKAYVLPILLFGSECWSLTKSNRRCLSGCTLAVVGASWGSSCQIGTPMSILGSHVGYAHCQHPSQQIG